MENHQRFLSFLERRLGTRASAEEILQGVVVRAIESESAPDDSEGVVQWLYRVLRNAVIDHQRRQSVEASAVERLAQEGAGASSELELRDAICECFKGVLPSLKPEYAQMVQAVDLEERPIGQVAAELGLTANNATVRLHRSRQALKRQLQRACGSCATHGCLDCTCPSSRRPD